MQHTLKRLARTLLALLFLPLAVAFSSCQNSDEEPDDPVSPIVGTWSTQSDNIWDDLTCIVFRANGTGIYAENYNSVEGKLDIDNFSYTYDENTRIITLIFTDGGDFETEVYTGVTVTDEQITGFYENDYEHLISLKRVHGPRASFYCEPVEYIETNDALGFPIYYLPGDAGTYHFHIHSYTLWHENIPPVTVLSVENDPNYDPISCTVSGLNPSTLTVNASANNSGKEKSHSLDLKIANSDYSASFNGIIFLHQKTQEAGGNNGGNSGSDSTEPQWGKVTANIAAYSGYPDDSYVDWVDGQTDQVDYVYYPSTGKYYVYGGIFCSDNTANGGKGIRYEAKQGYNSIQIDGGADYYYLGDRRINYRWEVYLRVTLP